MCIDIYRRYRSSYRVRACCPKRLLEKQCIVSFWTTNLWFCGSAQSEAILHTHGSDRATKVIENTRALHITLIKYLSHSDRIAWLRAFNAQNWHLMLQLLNVWSFNHATFSPHFIILIEYIPILKGSNILDFFLFTLLFHVIYNVDFVQAGLH